MRWFDVFRDAPKRLVEWLSDALLDISERLAEAVVPERPSRIERRVARRGRKTVRKRRRRQDIEAREEAREAERRLREERRERMAPIIRPGVTQEEYNYPRPTRAFEVLLPSDPIANVLARRLVRADYERAFYDILSSAEDYYYDLLDAGVPGDIVALAEWQRRSHRYWVYVGPSQGFSL